MKIDIDHVWTVDGDPLGIRHELELDGDHVIARDVGIKHGRVHGTAHERRVTLIQAVHVLLNATAAELEAIENRFIEDTPRPEEPWCATPAQKQRLREAIRARQAEGETREPTSDAPTRWTGSGPRKYPSRGLGPGRTSPLDCAHCGLSCGPSGEDPCIENLPGAMNACCGHGDPEEAYIQFSPTHRIGGQEAWDRQQAMKAADPMPLGGRTEGSDS